MNRVIYCRVSSKEQVDGTSLDSQELACREYAARNHIDVVTVFVERGESAKFADRTQLLELLAFCRDRSKAIDCLLVWKVDRLARNVGDHFDIKASLLKQNIRVISATEPIDANPEGKLLETILAGFAQFDNGHATQAARRTLPVEGASGLSKHYLGQQEDGARSARTANVWNPAARMERVCYRKAYQG